MEMQRVPVDPVVRVALRLFALPLLFTAAVVLFSLQPTAWSSALTPWSSAAEQQHQRDALWWHKMEYADALACHERLALLDRLRAAEHLRADVYDNELQRVVDEVSRTVRRPVALEEIRTAVMEQGLTLMQRVQGLLSFVTLMWVFSIVCGVVSLSVLCYRYLVPLALPLLRHLSRVVWEIAAYVVALAVVLLSYRASDDVGQFLALTGVALAVGCFVVTGAPLLQGYWGYRGLTRVAPLALLLLATDLGALALLYDSKMLAAATALVLQATLTLPLDLLLEPLLGGRTNVVPLYQTLTASLALLGPAMLATGYPQWVRAHLATAPGLSARGATALVEAVQLFAPATMWIAGNVLGGCLLVYGSRWRSPYTVGRIVRRTLLAALCFAGLLAAASVLQLLPLQGVLGTWAALFLLVKWCELPYNAVGFLTVGMLGLCSLLYALALVLRTHPQYAIGLF